MSISVADSTAEGMNNPQSRRETDSSQKDREFHAELDQPWSLPPLTPSEDAVLQVGPYHNNVADNPATHPRDRPIHTDYDSQAPVYYCKRKLWTETDKEAGPVEVDLPSSFYDLSDVLKAPDNSVVYADWLTPMTVHIDLLQPLYPDDYDLVNDLNALSEHQDALIAEYDPTDPSVRRKDLEGTIEQVNQVTGPTRFAELGRVPPRMRQFAQYATEFFQHFGHVDEEHNQGPLKGIKRDRPDWVAVCMGLIRYRGRQGQENRNTDVVISVSVPHISGLVEDFTREDDDQPETYEETRKIPLVQKARLVLDRILQTFDVVDDSLLAT